MPAAELQSWLPRKSSFQYTYQKPVKTDRDPLCLLTSYRNVKKKKKKKKKSAEEQQRPDQYLQTVSMIDCRRSSLSRIYSKIT